MTTHDEQVFAPAAQRVVRLLCLFLQAGGFYRSYPVATLWPMPPRVGVQGQWNLARLPVCYLREAHAVQPSPEVLERVLQLRQGHAIRPDLRTLRTGVMA